MGFFESLKSKMKGGEGSDAEAKMASKIDMQTHNSWFKDRYESLVVQRSVLIVLFLISIAVIVFLNISITYIKSSKSIEPFVIEIEPKTGVPTVIEPLSAVLYTGQEAIVRHLVWQYITMREEYNYADFFRVYRDIRVFSSDAVYGQYRGDFNVDNLRSPYNVYGENNVVRIELKSLILQDDKKSAQVRFRRIVEGSRASVSDKIVLMRFDFVNLELSEDRRLLNPLGFIVTSYRIDDERV